MHALEYTIAVVDVTTAPWPDALDLILAGVPSDVADEWACFRLAYSPDGLQMQLSGRVN